MTLTFTPVIPTTWDPTRQIVNDFIEAIVAVFQAAVPGVIRKQWSEIPASYTGEGPLVYIGDIVETISHSGGTTWMPNNDGYGLRQTLFTGTIGYVDVATDNQEANTRANSFADYMREVFTANSRIYSTGIFQQTGLAEAPADQGPLNGFQHLILTWTFTILEGRP